jgi:hypothetical protein
MAAQPVVVRIHLRFYDNFIIKTTHNNITNEDNAMLNC